MRYNHVNVVKLSGAMLDDIREVNKQRCETHDLLPTYAPNMQYFCLTKTHFVHACKLDVQGNRTLFNEGKVKISFSQEFEEARLIRDSGIVCAVYSEDIVKDSGALSALMGDDNLNANVQMREDEMVAFTRVGTVIEEIDDSPRTPEKGPKLQAHSQHQHDVKLIINRMRELGFGSFTEEAMIDFIKLRSSLPSQVAAAFAQCQFHCVGGQARVKHGDYGLTTRLDPRAPWTKISVLLSQYLSALKGRQTGPKTNTELQFQGRSEQYAVRLHAPSFVELREEIPFVLSVEHFIKAMIRRYKIDGNADMGPALRTRTSMLGACGRYVARVGTKLANASTKAKARDTTFTVPDREAEWKPSMDQKLAEIECIFRKELVRAEFFTASTLPRACHELQTQDADGRTANASNTPGLLVATTTEHEAFATTDQGTHDSSWIMNRLEITELGAHVYFRPMDNNIGEPDPPLTFIKREVDDEAVGDQARSQLSLDVTPAMKLPASVVKLLKIESPLALIEFNEQSCEEVTEKFSSWVHADYLSPARWGGADGPPVAVPSIQLLGFDYDLIFERLVIEISRLGVSWAHMLTIDSVQGVDLFALNNGSQPYKMRAQAGRQFNKHQLVLVPFTTTEVIRASVTKRDTHKIIDESLQQRASCSVRFRIARSSAEQGGDEGRWQDGDWVLTSPLLDIPKANSRDNPLLQGVPPYWAIPKDKGVGSQPTVANMIIETITFDVTGFAPVGGSFFPRLMKGAKCSFNLNIMRNNKTIKGGDELTLLVG